jgi:hypothetical protein
MYRPLKVTSVLSLLLDTQCIAVLALRCRIRFRGMHFRCTNLLSLSVAGIMLLLLSGDYGMAKAHCASEMALIIQVLINTFMHAYILLDYTTLIDTALFTH